MTKWEIRGISLLAIVVAVSGIISLTGRVSKSPSGILGDINWGADIRASCTGCVFRD